MEELRQSRGDSSSPKGANRQGLRFGSLNILKPRQATELNAISFEAGEMKKLRLSKRAVNSNLKWRQAWGTTSPHLLTNLVEVVLVEKSQIEVKG
jgi:hypothetical protein